jgi:hypothetical protein
MIYKNSKSKKITSKKFKRNKGYKTVKGGMITGAAAVKNAAGRIITSSVKGVGNAAGRATRGLRGVAGSAAGRVGQLFNPLSTSKEEVNRNFPITSQPPPGQPPPGQGPSNQSSEIVEQPSEASAIVAPANEEEIIAQKLGISILKLRKERSNPRLLLISDLEGCSEKKPRTETPQFTGMCSDNFFTRLMNFLTISKKNKIAFLGDYFDQGPDVLNSIDRIATLHMKYPTQVHIILGNRDINKLRLIYEMNNTNQLSTSEQTTKQTKWGLWNKLYAKLESEDKDKPDLFTRLESILKDSMGIINSGIPNPTEPPTALIFNIKDRKTNPHEGAYLLLRCFSLAVANNFFNSLTLDTQSLINRSEIDNINVGNVKYLFENGNILYYDKDFKVLLSHAGGCEFPTLPNKLYYENIKKTLNGDALNYSYYEKLDHVRNQLQNEDVLPTNSGTNVKTTSQTFKPSEADVKLSIFNEPLTCIKTEKLFTNPPDIPSADYYLLQGLGLKPDPKKKFMSFVESCSINAGCKGPNNISPSYLGELNTLGIKIIAHGHVPHCTPIPIIYKGNSSPITFIGNDTSNGYRPDDITLDNFPLSYVSKNGVMVGITSISNNGICEKLQLEQTSSLYKYRFMVSVWNTSDMMPTLINNETCPEIDYKNGNILTFPSCRDTTPTFKAAEFIEKSIGTKIGGCHNCKHTHKYKSKSHRKSNRK